MGGDRLGVADRQEGKNNDGLGEQHIEGDRSEREVVVVKCNETSAPGQMSKRKEDSDEVEGVWWER